MGMANRRNAELHSGELPYVEMRAVTWVPKLWKVCEMLLEVQGKTLDDWLGKDIAAEAKEEMKKAPTIPVVEGKLKVHRGKFEKAYLTIDEQQKVRSSKRFSLAAFLPLWQGMDADYWAAVKCTACGCEVGGSVEKWMR